LIQADRRQPVARQQKAKLKKRPDKPPLNRLVDAYGHNFLIQTLPANMLTLRIQPDEGLSVSFSAKRPGTEIEIDSVAMDFAYRDYFEPVATVGYETLIHDCLICDAALFQRADTVEVQGLIDSWSRDSTTDFPNYAAGSAGPVAADRLLACDGRAWFPIGADHPHAAIRPKVAASIAAKVTP
jgi:Glucose-6-phosphate dehydrogenase, C-terminal domain